MGLSYLHGLVGYQRIICQGPVNAPSWKKATAVYFGFSKRGALAVPYICVTIFCGSFSEGCSPGFDQHYLYAFQSTKDVCMAEGFLDLAGQLEIVFLPMMEFYC